jgi:hypothetical protein
MKTTNIPWRPKEDTDIQTVKGKGSSRRKKKKEEEEEVERKNKNEKQGGPCGVELLYFGQLYFDDYAVGLIQLNYVTRIRILIQY